MDLIFHSQLKERYILKKSANNEILLDSNAFSKINSSGSSLPATCYGLNKQLPPVDSKSVGLISSPLVYQTSSQHDLHTFQLRYLPVLNILPLRCADSVKPVFEEE